MNSTDMYPGHSSFIWPLWPRSWVFVYELSGSRFESSCSHLNFRFCAWFEQGILDIQATIECGFTLKRIRGMTKTYSKKNRTGKYSEYLNHLASLAIWLIVCLRTKWFWVRDQLQSMIFIFLLYVILNAYYINNFWLESMFSYFQSSSESESFETRISCSYLLEFHGSLRNIVYNFASLLAKCRMWYSWARRVLIFIDIKEKRFSQLNKIIRQGKIDKELSIKRIRHPFDHLSLCQLNFAQWSKLLDVLYIFDCFQTRKYDD